MAAEPALSDFLRSLQDQLPTAEIIGVNQNQAGRLALADIVEVGFRLNGHPEPLVFRAPYADLHSGFVVVTMSAFVESLLRVYLLGTGLAPETVVPMPGAAGVEPPLPPGPVLP